MPTSDDVLDFWFEEHGPEHWWTRSESFDAEIRTRFEALNRRAALCELHAWRDRPDGRLAEIIVLDQFSRNLYRDDPRAFASDAMALALAQEAVRTGADQALAPERRLFVYVPYEHSESPAIHADAVHLFAALGDAEAIEAARQHKAIIDRFGHYPHRNAARGRPSTPEELAFLQEPHSSF